MVFQDPLSSLDPRLPVWRIITEPVWIQQRRSERERRQLAETLAQQVGIRAEYLDRLPHAFSGGQRQRIAIARALSSDPDIIVLDEPTSALDISVQAQILNLLVALQQQRNLTYVLISHNVSVVRHMSDRVAVMYLGQIVELGPADQCWASHGIRIRSCCLTPFPVPENRWTKIWHYAKPISPVIAACPMAATSATAARWQLKDANGRSRFSPQPKAEAYAAGVTVKRSRAFARPDISSVCNPA